MKSASEQRDNNVYQSYYAENLSMPFIRFAILGRYMNIQPSLKSPVLRNPFFLSKPGSVSNRSSDQTLADTPLSIIVLCPLSWAIVKS